MWNPYVPQVEDTGRSATLWGLLMFPIRCPHWVGGQFAPGPGAARAYQGDQPREINKVYATLTTVTDPLFRSMADGLQGLERAPGPSRR